MSGNHVYTLAGHHTTLSYPAIQNDSIKIIKYLASIYAVSHTSIGYIVMALTFVFIIEDRVAPSVSPCPMAWERNQKISNETLSSRSQI